MRSIASYAVFCRLALVLSFFFGEANFAVGQDTNSTISAGFIFDRFKLTLEDGMRTEAAGPFYYSEQKEDESTVAFPPFFSYYKNPAVESVEYDFLYPLLTYE